MAAALALTELTWKTIDDFEAQVRGLNPGFFIKIFFSFFHFDFFIILFPLLNTSEIILIKK